MPYETIRFACGCEREVSLTGNSRQRRQRAEWLSRQTCLVCQRKQEHAEATPELDGRLLAHNGLIRLYLTVQNGFPVRDGLKAQGWRFDGFTRTWEWDTPVSDLDEVRRIVAGILELGITPTGWLAQFMAGDNAQAEAEWARADAAAQWMTMVDAQRFVPLSVLQAAIADGRVRLSHAGPIRYVHRDDVLRLAEEVASGSRSDQ